MPYERYVAEHIFQRADMASTGYPQVDGLEPNIALGYTRRTAMGRCAATCSCTARPAARRAAATRRPGSACVRQTPRREGRLPTERQGLGIAGGAPGTNAVVESDGVWTVDRADQPRSARGRTARPCHHAGAGALTPDEIVVIEDDAVVSDTLAAVPEQAGLTSSRQRTARAGLPLAASPDVVSSCSTLMIPGLTGLEVCRRLRAVSTVPIVMLTARVSEDDRLAGFDAGADDYVAKPFSPREVVARVQALLAARRAVSRAAPASTAVGDLEVDFWARQARSRAGGRADGHRISPARRARAASRPRVHTGGAGRARFGPDYDGLDRTVDAHITNLRQETRARREPRYVLTAHGLGYRLAAADDL